MKVKRSTDIIRKDSRERNEVRDQGCAERIFPIRKLARNEPVGSYVCMVGKPYLTRLGKGCPLTAK